MNSIENRVRQAYNSGYDMGFKDGYYKGLEEAWECAKKIYHMSAEKVIAIFGSCSNWVDFTAEEAIEKIRAYESKLNEPEEKKIEVTEENFRKVCEALKYITEKECCSYDYGDVCDMADAYLEQTKGVAE